MIVRAVEEAIVEFDGAIGADSNMDIAYHNRGQANFRLGRFETVKNDYGQAESLYAGSSLFKTKLGDAYLSSGQHEPVVQEQNQVIKRDSGFAIAYYNRGRRLC